MPPAWRSVGTLIVDEAQGLRSEVLEELRSRPTDLLPANHQG